MVPIIFARIADMKYYKGITETDTPHNGGTYVKNTKMAHECYNFSPMKFKNNDTEYCLGFTMLIGKNTSQLRIENISGCEKCKNADKVDNVIVVFCARPEQGKTMRIVGFYKHATVYRKNDIYCTFSDNYVQNYNFIAEVKDCVLLPYRERFESKWFVPVSGKMGYSFGFGHSNIWFAGSNTDNLKEIAYVNTIINNIETYTEENLI